MCGCSIAAGLENKLVDNLKMARETRAHIQMKSQQGITNAQTEMDLF